MQSNIARVENKMETTHSGSVSKKCLPDAHFKEHLVPSWWYFWSAYGTFKMWDLAEKFCPWYEP